MMITLSSANENCNVALRKLADLARAICLELFRLKMGKDGKKKLKGKGHKKGKPEKDKTANPASEKTKKPEERKTISRQTKEIKSQAQVRVSIEKRKRPETGTYTDKVRSIFFSFPSLYLFLFLSLR